MMAAVSLYIIAMIGDWIEAKCEAKNGNFYQNKYEQNVKFAFWANKAFERIRKTGKYEARKLENI